MKTEKLNIVRFAPKGKNNFYDAVMATVQEYFESNNISPFANREMWTKTAIMTLLYFVPYIFIVTGIAANNTWLFFILWLCMGAGLSGIGTSVMHDANHNAYSSDKKVNTFVSHILEIIGGYTITWKIQHNILHHTYTNVNGLDEDIDSVVLLRFSPYKPLRWFHRYQYLYAWFFYMMMTLFWMTAKDYLQIFRYKHYNLLVKQKISITKALIHISSYKILYYIYILVLPLIFSGMPWYLVFIGFLMMHFVAGLFLSCVFQPSHIMESSPFSSPVSTNGKCSMENSWAVHEVLNTTDYAQGNRLLSWFIGGLNFQIEHHLFSGICHVHYRKIAPIVRSTIIAFGLPYHTQPTFFRALLEHTKMLKKLGRDAMQR